MRVVLAEDQGLLRDSLAFALQRNGIDITATAASLPETLSVVDADPPDAVLLDIRMPPTGRDEGLQAAEHIRVSHPQVAIVVLSQYAETAYAVRLLSMDTEPRALGYLLKHRVADVQRLADALHRVASGEVVIDPELVTRLMSRARVTNPLDRLSPRERDVLHQMAEGRSNAFIARRFGCSAKAVEKYITTINNKLGLNGTVAGRDVNTRVLAVLTYLRNSH